MTAQSREPDPATVAPTLRLELDGRSVSLQVRRRTTERSAHSGRELEELHGWVATADAETHAWLSRALQEIGDQAVRAQDESGEFAGKWQVSWNAYGESGGVHTYTLILRECEELNLETLLVEAVELHPYEYREEIVGTGLAIWAKMVGTRDDVLRLRPLLRGGRILSVVRRGIQDEPRRMWVGVAEWSRSEDRIKYRLVLVEEGVERGAHPELARIERHNSRAALGFYMNFAERLVDLLVQKGVVSPQEIDALREEASALPIAVRHDFWQVMTDIDEL